MSETSGLILAAGAGSRFGEEPKLLADLNGRPVLEHAIAAQCAVPELERVVVVLGAHAEQLLAGVRFGRAQPLLCLDWMTGLSASLRCGAAALAGSERVIVTLGDSPTVTAALLRRFLTAPIGARAVYRGQPGHPVVLGRDHLAELAQVDGDLGARTLLSGGATIECGDLASGGDIDTPADLRRLRTPDS